MVESNPSKDAKNYPPGKSLAGESQKLSKELSYQGSVASDYLATRAATIGWHSENISVATLMSLLPDSQTILDVPFGTGRFTPLYAAKRWTATGLDISSDMLSIAELYNKCYAENIHYESGDVSDLRFGSSTFDGVVSVRFLGYIPSLDKAKQMISEMARVSKSFAILNLQHLRPGQPMGEEDKMGHRWYRQEVVQYLESLNLRIEKLIESTGTVEYQNVFVLCRLKLA